MEDLETLVLNLPKIPPSPKVGPSRGGLRDLSSEPIKYIPYTGLNNVTFTMEIWLENIPFTRESC